MLRFCNGPQIAAPYKSIGKIFDENSFDAKEIEGRVRVKICLKKEDCVLGFESPILPGRGKRTVLVKFYT